MIAVQHAQVPPRRRFPEEETRPRFGGPSQVNIRCHDEEIDTVVDQFVGEPPWNARDIELACHLYRQTADGLQPALAVEQAPQTRRVGKRGRMPAQRGQPDTTGPTQRKEPVDQILRRPVDPTQHGFSRLASPFWGSARLEVADRVLEPGDDLGQVLLLQLPKDGLRMRVAGIQMAVMEKENFIDHGTYDAQCAVASIRPTTIDNVTLAGHKGRFVRSQI